MCVRAIFAFAGGYKLGERYLLGELERRLLPLRLALRPLRQALRYPWLCAPSVDPSGDLRTSRQSVRPVLGGIGLEFPDHGKLRRRPGLQHRIVPNPDPRDGRRCGFHLRQCGSRVFTGDRRLDSLEWTSSSPGGRHRCPSLRFQRARTRLLFVWATEIVRCRPQHRAGKSVP